MIGIYCVSCRKHCNVSCTQEQLSAWRRGQRIQDAMPNVPKAERELLLSGLCGECFREMCAEQDTDY